MTTAATRGSQPASAATPLPSQVQAATAGQAATANRAPLLTNPLENAVYLVREWAALNAERGQAMLDAVTLAAEQVQDVRLLILESPKRVASSDILMSGLFEFMLNGSLAGPLLRKAASAVLGGMINVASLFRGGLAYGTSRERAAGVEFFRYCRDLWRYDPGKGVMSKVEPNETTAFAALLDLLLKKTQTNSAAVEKDLSALVKAARAIAKQRRSDSPIYAPDTVAVDLLQTAQARSSGQRVLVAKASALLEGLARGGEIKPPDVLTQINRIDLPELDTAIAECRLKTEALIWAGLHKPEITDSLVQAASPAFGGRLGFPDIDDRLVDYWLERFDPLLKEYAKEHPSNPYAPIRYRRGGAPGEWEALTAPPPPRRAGDKFNPNANLNIRITWLIEYFRDLRQNFARATERTLRTSQ